MPPKSYVMQQLMKQVGGSTAPTTISEPDFMSRDFRPMDFSDSPPSNSGNPVMDLAQIMYQGGVGDTRGTGGMPGSGSDPMNYVSPANPPMETGSFRRVPRPVYDSYTEELNYGRGMPGGGSNYDIPFDNAANIVEQSMPNMQIRGTAPQVNLPSLAGYDYPEDPEGTSLEPPVQTSGSFRSVPNPTEQAYQASLPGINRIQANAQTQMAMNEGRLDPSPKYARTANLKRGVQIGAPYQGTPDSLKQGAIPEEMEPGMLYNAREAAPGVAAKAGEIAGKTAKTAGFLGRGLAKMGGSALNSLLYGNTDKGLFDNLNQTLYGGEKSFRENMFDLPPAQSNTAETGSMRDIVKKHISSNKPGKPTGGGGFKSAFAAARKAGKKTFKWKNPKTGKTIEYTTALASDKKKTKSGKSGNVSDFMEQILGKQNNDPSALQGSFRRVKPRSPFGISYYGGRP